MRSASQALGPLVQQIHVGGVGWPLVRHQRQGQCRGHGPLVVMRPLTALAVGEPGVAGQPGRPDPGQCPRLTLSSEIGHVSGEGVRSGGRLAPAEPTAMARRAGTTIPCAEHRVRPILRIRRERRTRWRSRSGQAPAEGRATRVAAESSASAGNVPPAGGLGSRRRPAPAGELMATLESLTPGATVQGLLPDRSVSVVQAEWHGSGALTLTYRDEAGRVGQELVYRDDEPRLDVAESGRAWSLDADGQLFRLVSKAKRISLAYLFDPFLAVQTSTLEPLPHQIEAVYDGMLDRQPLRFLLADDPGAGKTIMAGLLCKE